ncbi:MAG: 2-amino-4-hydroxy-6-hydroxymethyldihydropteridine diphosphokinase [Planctomycetia bacterium]|nr:2-amino-4-hydroxy-6-hydroxymethyldihydropteridine diphosphokinase [Planctomycetia bacterium]
MGIRCLIGLGSNLGDRKAHLDFAVAALSDTPGVIVRAVSRFRETAPVGGPVGQKAFLNAAAAIETSMAPESLLDRLNAIEHEAGRVRSEHWGERTLDLDLLLYGDTVLETPRLEVPHPRMMVRRFVLAPLAEIAPDFVEPSTGMTIASLLANLDRRPSYVALFRHRGDQQWIFPRLVTALSAIGLSSGHGDGAGDCFERRWRWQGNAESGLRLLEQTATELRGDRWSEALWGDRWVVTDFWFDRVYFLARSMTPPSKFAELHDRFLQLRPNVIAPTFLVLDRRIKVPEIQGYFSDESSPFPGPGRAVPTLRPDTDDPDELASEIRSACVATRTG